MSKMILVANWKNHPSSFFEADFLLRQMSKNRLKYKKVSLFIAPPLPYFETVKRRSSGYAQLASQNLFSVPKGTYTGVVTLDILKSFGIKLAILGHSESRALGETNELISQKIKMALNSDITPLLCVGELSRDNDGEHFEFLREEIKLSLMGLNKRSDISKLAIAYEPVWAIGKSAKDAISSLDLSQTIIFIKKVLTDIFGRTKADKVPILYGGSVESSNVKKLMTGTGIKGLLVGHASINATSFLNIIEELTTK